MGGLVLTRKIGESIFIGRDVCVTVATMGGGQVKLHVVAPDTMAVSRGEFTVESHLLHQQRREQQAAREVGRNPNRAKVTP